MMNDLNYFIIYFQQLHDAELSFFECLQHEDQLSDRECVYGDQESSILGLGLRRPSSLPLDLTGLHVPMVDLLNEKVPPREVLLEPQAPRHLYPSLDRSVCPFHLQRVAVHHHGEKRRLGDVPRQRCAAKPLRHQTLLHSRTQSVYDLPIYRLVC